MIKTARTTTEKGKTETIQGKNQRKAGKTTTNLNVYRCGTKYP